MTMYYVAKDSYYDGIYHHGIKGQKWYVRRYQNEDGTLTEAGKKRYSLSGYMSVKMADAEKRVRAKLNNDYKPIRKEPINIRSIMDRSGLDAVSAVACARLAISKYKAYSKIESRITNDVISVIQSTTSKMYGLEHRLKQPSSLAGKIGADSNGDANFKRVADNIKDVIRYTAISDNRDYVKNYRSIRNGLAKKGYREIGCKNYFSKYRTGEVSHKAIQSTFESSRGHKFEIQFHTPASQAAKELKLPLYEEIRKVGTSTARATSLKKKMVNLAELVSDPPNIMRIKTH